MPLDSTGDKELQEAERAAGTGIKGRYVAIVRLRALDDGRTEWNDPSGMIPRSLVERGFPETLAHVSAKSH
ncbi:hypothetical protein FRB98_002320 [Tulasnella sp. 332]|nr:hypothetical protein FRB98_002320 [Tulasnella sp. 332]